MYSFNFVFCMIFNNVILHFTNGNNFSCHNVLWSWHDSNATPTPYVVTKQYSQKTLPDAPPLSNTQRRCLITDIVVFSFSFFWQWHSFALVLYEFVVPFRAELQPRKCASLRSPKCRCLVLAQQQSVIFAQFISVTSGRNIV